MTPTRRKIWRAVGRVLAVAAAGGAATLALGLLPRGESGETKATKPARAIASTNIPAQLLETTNAVKDLRVALAAMEERPPVRPGPFDPLIARFTAHLVQEVHYSRHRFDDEISKRFFDQYLEMLDPQRLYFLQADVEEFANYRETLDDLALQKGSLLPAYQIFSRFLLRLRQRARFAADMLETNRFRFDADERYTPDRSEAPRPADMEAAHTLWRQHLRFEYLQEKLSGKKREEIVKTLARRYRRSILMLSELDGEDILQLYLSALCRSYDPHTDYMGRAQLDNFAINMKLSLFGIGALLRWEDGYCKVESLVPGGPAERSKKLHPGDRIVAVQQEGGEPVDVVDMKLQKIVDLIRGPKGTKVTLFLIPAKAADPSERKKITLVRDEIKLVDQQAKAELIELKDAGGRKRRIGLIDLPSFYASVKLGSMKEGGEPRSTTADVAKLLRKLEEEHVEGVILDLRRNGGGSLEEAIRLTGLFIKEGPVVQVRNANGEVLVESDPDPTALYEGPMIVMTSRFSASASEILAGALQDYGRALIVGDKSTFGKGTVQTILELARSGQFPPDIQPGALKVTIRKFYRPNGESTQLRGVIPDIVLPSVNNELDVGEASRKNALPWDTIEKADFKPLNLIQPVLPELRRRTEARQAKDPEFAYIREDIAEYRRREADKSVSLNEARRRKEKKETEARLEARKKERAARKRASETRYEITLEWADKPGLPEPLPDQAESSKQKSSFAKVSSEDQENQDEENAPDAALMETKRILLDLIDLSAEGKSLKPPAMAAAEKKKPETAQAPASVPEPLKP